MSSRILKFELNEPVAIALQTLTTLDVISAFNKPEVLFILADNRRLYATPELAAKIRNLGVKEFESFSIRKWKQGRRMLYDVWLSPATEKAKAIEEAPAIAAELSQPSNVFAMPQPIAIPAPELAPTGTEGKQGSALPMRSIATARPPSNIIPFNVAFREVVKFVSDGLKDSGEQWNDEARQGAISTVLISAAQHGWIGPWDREK